MYLLRHTRQERDVIERYYVEFLPPEILHPVCTGNTNYHCSDKDVTVFPLTSAVSCIWCALNVGASFMIMGVYKKDLNCAYATFQTYIIILKRMLMIQCVKVFCNSTNCGKNLAELGDDCA